MRKALILPFREVRTMCCPAALSAQHRGDRAQGIKELSAEEYLTFEYVTFKMSTIYSDFYTIYYDF